MKKSVIILIGAIYIVAIVCVGFFGRQLSVYDPIIYIEEINCTNSNIRENLDGSKTIRLDYVEGGDLLENSIIITYEIYPKNTTLKGANAVKLVYDEDQTIATVDRLTISFKKKGVFIVQIKSLDGSNITETVKIIAY